MKLRSRLGQSLMELLIGMAVGGVFVIGTATIIASSLRTSQEVGLVQGKAELANEMVSNIQAWAAGNWNNVLGLATGTTNTYSLNTSKSPFVIAVGGSASSTPSFPSLVEAKSYAGVGHGGSSTVTFSIPTTQGELIVLEAYTGTNGKVIGTPTDNKGDTYTKIFDDVPGAGIDYSMWYAADVPAGVTEVSSTAGSGNLTSDLSLIAAHYTGIVTSSPLDVFAYSTGYMGSPWASPSVTTTQANELMVGQDWQWGGGSVGGGASGNWTTEATSTDGYSGNEMIYEDQVVSTIQTNVSNTGSGGAYNWPAIATFEGPPTSNSSQYPTSSEAITLEGIVYSRYFYLTDAYRDSNGNVTTTASGNSYDPSTKLVTVVVTASTTPTSLPITLNFYLTRNQNSAFSQTSWAGGAGQTSPVSVAGTDYADETNVGVTATGSIELSIGNGSCIE